MEPVIRSATRDDFAALSVLYEQLQVAGDPSLSPGESRRRFEALLERPGHTMFVAEIGGEVVGTYALIFIPGLTHGGRDSAIVEDVVVSPAHRGKGIGTWMMRDAMERSRRRECYKLVLSSHLQRDNAHRFYEGLGFRKHGFSFLVT